MPCDPSSLKMNVNSGPPIGIPGFGLEIAPLQIPFPNLSMPTGLIEDLKALVDSLKLLFPSGTFTPSVDSFTKKIFDLIGNLLTMIQPYLSLYNFFIALLNLIMCIIEVICALLNPFKLVAAVIKLFSKCLPAFMLLFPWLALIAMIIALLLLILALIEYLITMILAIIAEIIRNIAILVQGMSFQDAEATLAAIQKLANLMCLIQNLMAILSALAAIMAIVKALSLVGGAAVCDDDDCCGADVCPPFLKAGGWTVQTGQLTYSSLIGVDPTQFFNQIPGLPANFDASIIELPEVRKERWQLVDTSLASQYYFTDIITPVPSPTDPDFENVFWPEDTSFTSKTPVKKACYTCDIKLTVNPASFGLVDTQGARVFVIKNCIVVREPYLGVFDYQEEIDLTSNSTGTVNLEGGKVYEEDGTTAYMINGEQATLNTFIHLASQNTLVTPSTNDQIVFDNVEFTLKPGYEALMSYQLITIGCHPSVRIEKEVLNSVLAAEDIRAVIQKLPPTPAGERVASDGILPNVQGAQDCVLSALDGLRNNVSMEGAAEFQAIVQTCLGDLKNQTLASICEAIIAATSQFKSEMTLDKDIEFISRPIDVKVILKDPAGTNISNNIPDSCVPQIIDKLKGEVTLGKVSDFSYDGSSFHAKISSEKAGTGQVNITFDGKVFSQTVAAVPGISSSKIIENILDYTFVDAVVEPVVRRNNNEE